MRKLKSICVFCGSSEGNDTAIIESATKLGKTLAKNNITLVYGAAKIGIMGLVAKGTLDNKGKVIGIIPEFLKLKEVVHLGLTEIITTQNMRDRKMLMQEKSDGFITMPGGMGTFEELFEILTWLQLGLHSKPIGLLNINHYYDDLLAMLEKMVKKGFLSMDNFKLLLVDENIDSLIEKMKNFKDPQKPKWLNTERV
ncbi:MAG: TIGR00730 family Rossman fold protein [Flavobacteriaceae bacterium]|nr:TIGR00730 family Rossman fold protein [Flavobacteriaceae bacterium]